MKLEDIIALAKQGYKPADIKELIELSKEDAYESDNQGETPGDAAESEQTTPEDSKPTETPENVDSIDYRKLYEEEHSKLLNAQRTNLNQNMDGLSKSDEEIVLDLFKNLK